MIEGFGGRFRSTGFRKLLAAIVLAEIFTVCVAWLFLSIGIAVWTKGRIAELVHSSRALAGATDWSGLAFLRTARSAHVLDPYRKIVQDLSKRDFPRNDGEVSVVVIRQRTGTYIISPHDQSLEGGPASPMEMDAFTSRRETFTAVPYSDNNGTYLAAYTPIVERGKVLAIAEAEYDSSTLPEIQGVVRSAFLFAVIPAIGIAVLAGFVLSTWLVEPEDVFREIEQQRERASASPVAARSSFLDVLSPREHEVADCVRRGLTNPKIASELNVSTETVKAHLKHIREKTGFNKTQLAIQWVSEHLNSDPARTDVR